MKKQGGYLLILLLVLNISFAIVSATNHTGETTGADKSSRIASGFQCLEEKANSCATTNTQETSIIILATPDNIFDECVSRLNSLKTGDNWGDVRDTALAVLALDHAGEDTEDAENWLLDQTRTPDELIWYLEQDSNVATECNIQYNGEDNRVSIGSDKKIDRNAGSCLTRSQSNFWLRISEECYGDEFIVSCDEDFITTLLYKNKNSPTIYVLDGTSSAPALGSTSVKIDSKCFGTSSCDYEGTVWATEALLRTGHSVTEYIPYVIALADSNREFLPEAFAYMITNYEDYANALVAKQRLGNFWEAEGTAYDKFYDTSLALISLEGASSSEVVDKAKGWLLFQQAANGCWKDDTLDTAMALWALDGRAGRTSGGDGGGSTTFCSQAGFFCIPNSDCLPAEDVSNNYFCSGLSTTCCLSENLKTCEAYSGSVCSDEEFCSGNEREAIDSNACCTGTCEEKIVETECEQNFYDCQSSCSDSQEDAGYSCGVGGEICCRSKPTGNNNSSNLWIWVIVALISVVLIAIIYVKREAIGEAFDKLKSKMSKGKGGAKDGSSPRGPRGPPGRPGMPPPRMPPMRGGPRQVGPPQAGMPMRGQRPRTRDPEMAKTFAKLNQISS